ncbi:phospholipid carrier-dependent glycosyltransferase [Streptomyces sp. LaPpAH-108]|uniref:phospholipid carrier-dependent glycosyltransferase n=1 Tax=Streptomyces sp. LaPpAH-108 TaxID=1155714 RepID=UPI000D0A98DA
MASEQRTAPRGEQAAPGDEQAPEGPRAVLSPARLRLLTRNRRWPLLLLIALLLGQLAVAMVTTAVQQTPTIDEPVYVATATDYLHEHRLRYNPEHPPLGKLLIAAGVAVADPRYDPNTPGTQGDVGRRLLYESGNDPGELMLWARLPVIALTLLTGLVVFAFARDLAGTAGGLVALALYAFSPDVIAHGSLATLDMPVTGFLVTAAWLAWRARRRPRRYVPLTGLALGAALATKMSALPAIPVLMLLVCLSVWHALPGTDRRRRALLSAGGAAGTAVLAVAVVWAVYAAVDPLLRFSPAEPVPALAGLHGRLTSLLPLPPAYRAGMSVQFAFENHAWQGFLFGRLYTGPLWYYLPAALLVKTPLALLALGAAGAVTVLVLRPLRPAAPYLLLPPALLLAVAMTGARDFGTRYALFVPVFLAVAAGCVTAVRTRHRWTVPLTGVLVAWAAASSLRVFPYYLSYANEAFGGPAATHRLLHDSNVDWGQDLGRLADRLREKYPGERVWLVYKGAGVPSAYGIHAADPRAVPVSQVRGLLVVSDSAAAKARGDLARLIRTSRPVGQVGYSITLYRR